MHALARPFVQLCLLRLRPQDLPASTLLLAITIATHTLSSILVSLITLGGADSVLAGVTDTVLVCGLAASLLWAHRLAPRLKQTLIALTGAGTVIGVIALPLMSWVHGSQVAGHPPGIATLLVLALIGWSITVSGHILRHALSVPLIVGLVISVVFYWISVTVLNSLFPISG